MAALSEGRRHRLGAAHERVGTEQLIGLEGTTASLLAVEREGAMCNGGCRSSFRTDFACPLSIPTLSRRPASSSTALLDGAVTRIRTLDGGAPIAMWLVARASPPMPPSILSSSGGNAVLRGAGPGCRCRLRASVMTCVTYSASVVVLPVPTGGGWGELQGATRRSA